MPREQRILAVLKMPVFIVMKRFFGGPSGPAKAVLGKYHGNGDFNSCLSDRSYFMVRAVPVQADTIFTLPTSIWVVIAGLPLRHCSNGRGKNRRPNNNGATIR